MYVNIYGSYNEQQIFKTVNIFVTANLGNNWTDFESLDILVDSCCYKK